MRSVLALLALVACFALVPVVFAAPSDAGFDASMQLELGKVALVAPAVVVTPGGFTHALHRGVDWIEANPGWSKLFALVLLVMLANGLARYPKAAGLLRYVHLGIDLLSPMVRKDSPGTWKPPLFTWSMAQGFALSLSQPPTPVSNGVNPSILERQVMDTDKTPIIPAVKK